jgi:hypothetical protein
MKNLTPAKAFAQVQSAAEQIRNDETADVGTVSLGDVIRQGDIYVVAIGQLPELRTRTTNRQLAPGTSQGSRHTLAGKCEVYEADKAEVTAMIFKHVRDIELHAELVGPVFKTLGPVTLEHPEHGNRILPADEVFAVYYQRQLAEEVRRQAD